MKTKTKNDKSVPKPSAQNDEPAGQGIWSGTISFGLVAIPVQLVKAIEPGRVSFRMLHNKEYSPLLRRMYCPEEGKIVPEDEIVRGYEIAADKYVLVSDEELASVSPERSTAIEIVGFIDIADVDPIYYDHPYYLVPMKGGEKSYRLLAEVMHRAGKAGLARFVLHEREYFVAVRSTGGALSVIMLHYSEEIIPDMGLAPREGRTDPDDKNRAKKLIKEMTAAFDPNKYADTRREKLLALLKKKAKGKALVTAPEVEEETTEGPADLVAVLEESMRKGKTKR
jgi:DNA end-binding protein Ku